MRGGRLGFLTPVLGRFTVLQALFSSTALTLIRQVEFGVPGNSHSSRGSTATERVSEKGVQNKWDGSPTNMGGHVKLVFRPHRPGIEKRARSFELSLIAGQEVPWVLPALTFGPRGES